MKDKGVIKVLVVNDNQKACNRFERFLTNAGCKVYVVNDGERALEVLKNITIDIVLLNVMMADSMGYLRYIKKTHSDIPVIMTNGGKDEKTSMKLMESGAFAYLSQPINFEHLQSFLISSILYNIKYN
ncbi:MAG: response regulator [bacterium]|nr:response regulator [bacterium]